MRLLPHALLAVILLLAACAEDLSTPAPGELVDRTAAAPLSACDEDPLVAGWTTDYWPLDGPSILALQAIDEQHGVAVGSDQRLWQTSDAGRSWTVRQLQPAGADPAGPVDLRQVSFPTRAAGFVLPDLRDTAPQLWYTTDGGMTWQLHRYPELSTLDNIYFFGPTGGVAVGTPSAYGERRLLRTADAGRTWSLVQDPVLRVADESLLAGPDGSVLVSGLDIDRQAALFQVFAHGGHATWTRPHTRPLSHLFVLPDGSLRARCDPERGGVSGTGNAINFQSFDGGQHWEAFGRAVPEAAALAGHWVSATEGFYLVAALNNLGTVGDMDLAQRNHYQIHRVTASGELELAATYPSTCAFEGPYAAFGGKVFVQARSSVILRLEKH